MVDVAEAPVRARPRDEIKVRKLTPIIGAEVSGVDLSQPLSDEIIEQIKRAWFDNIVLVFRDQNLTGEDQLRFAARFGPVAQRLTPPAGAGKKIPMWDDLMLITDKTDADGEPIGALGHGEMWFHTDKCYIERPHRASFLYGIEIPSAGGNTRFSSLYAAYDRLPDDLKRRFDGAMVMQGHQYGVGRRVDVNADLDKIHHFRQPLVVTNPDSGRKGLYVASQNTMWIEGMDRAESEVVLERLFALVEDESIIYEHKWRVGDLLLWDNLSCLHARTDWPKEETRLLRRCTVIGDKLY